MKTPTPADIDIARSSLWAAHCQLSLHSLRIKVLEFAGGVTPFNPSKHGENKVVGFATEWAALMEEVSKAEPKVATREEMRIALINEGR